MKGRLLTIAMLCGALISGAVAVYLTYQYIENSVASKEAELDRQYTPVNVVVAKFDLRPGDVVSSDTVALRKVPSGFVHSDAISADDFELIKGYALSYGVKSGETVLQAHVSQRKGGKFAALIDSGTRAVTISVDKLASAAGMLSPNDRVDMLLTTKKRDTLATVPLLSDVRVIATGVETSENPTGEVIQYNTVTLELTPENAAKVTHAKKVGDISFVLRGVEEKGVAFAGQIKKQDLLGTAVARGPWVEIIIGGK
ncbi:Flp pilus assembly protein CpaB [Amphritea balenae]|uniref:Flp pilus assembly protein CpaB n=1 Tax=Amphritea balenae TaxID=452629 RepID=A0A3P1SN19_9GAMM|nr:Flp pilus assembly protein CpaB [Amphritea balenae]RRC98603.1 Flp pilus assembly protein CpaB [Amphritea balenae]GGK65856.1 Flp pilus assembly protein CpaB [Amphritea balenae]